MDETIEDLIRRLGRDPQAWAEAFIDRFGHALAPELHYTARWWVASAVAGENTLPEDRS